MTISWEWFAIHLEKKGRSDAPVDAPLVPHRVSALAKEAEVEKILETLAPGTEMILWFGGDQILHCAMREFIPGSNWEGPVLKVVVTEGIDEGAITNVYARKLWAVTFPDEQADE